MSGVIMMAAVGVYTKGWKCAINSLYLIDVYAFRIGYISRQFRGYIALCVIVDMFKWNSLFIYSRTAEKRKELIVKQPVAAQVIQSPC